MPGKGKGKSRGKVERVEWRIKYQFNPKMLRNHTAEEIRAQMIEYYEENQEDMPGTHMVGLWRNPNNKNPRHKNWKSSDEERGGFDAFMDTIVNKIRGGVRLEAPVTKPKRRRGEPKPESKATRSDAMKQYHAQIRELRSKHPTNYSVGLVN